MKKVLIPVLIICSMKTPLTILIFLEILFSCNIISNNNDSTTRQYGEFTIKTDTISFNLKPYINPDVKISLTHAIKYGEKYYCYFNEDWASVYHSDVKRFFIISKDGNIEKNIALPNPIQNCVYFDLFVFHDTIYTKPYMEDKTYYLNLNKFKWIETNDVDDVIYEDERFYVTYLDFGEWGATTWFKDKISGKEYELASSGTIINRIDSNYYIAGGIKVLLIENPLKMKQCDTDYYYQKIKKKGFAMGTNSLLGTRAIYYDSSYSYWEFKEPKIYIATSFKVDDKLYYLCVDSINTYIEKIENKTLIPIQAIGKKYSIFNWSYSDRCKIQKDNSQLLLFDTKNRNLYGFIEIDGYEINIRYLKLTQ